MSKNCFLSLIVACFTFSASAECMEFEGYLESWSYDSKVVMQHLNITPTTVVDVAFGDCTFETDAQGNITQVGGLEMSLQNFKNVINDVHERGGKVKLSLGGATYPFCCYLRSESDAAYMAQMISRLIVQFNLDGIDLDIEDSPSSPYYYPQFPQNFILMTKLLQQAAPAGSVVTLTVPGGAWFEPWTTIIPKAQQYVTYITFMEYDIWVDPSRSFVQQIKWDLDYYQKLWGLKTEQMLLGLMPGKDDMGRNLSLSDAQELSQHAKKIKMPGVMIWSLNRDYRGLDGNPSGAYGDIIQSIIKP